MKIIDMTRLTFGSRRWRGLVDHVRLQPSTQRCSHRGCPNLAWWQHGDRCEVHRGKAR